MSDKLQILQADEIIKEIQSIRKEMPGLISDVKEANGAIKAFNSSLRSNNIQRYAQELQNLTSISRQLNQVNQQVSVQVERLSRVEANNARATAENARARRESAQAARQETLARERAERQAAKEARQNNESSSAYKRLSQEANRVKMTTKNLEAEILILTRDFKTGLISQQQYNQELAKLQGQFSAASSRAKQLDSDLKRIDANVGDRQRNVGNYRDAAMGAVKALNSQITTMIASYAGFHAIVNGTSSLIHNNYELSDSLADLQIRLHGNKEATDGLFDSLRKIDTRTSLGELVNTASIVAKKGVAAEEINGITKALDDYFIVAGKEAGNREEGTASIVKLISIFNEDKHITAERVTEIGTALVKLQNSGVATGSKMIDIAERIGAVRGITGVTLPQVLGFAAAIEQLGQKSEVAGTAGMQILTKILSDMPKYAKLAGISTKELRKAYNDNPFEAVVKVAEGVLKTGDFERISQDLEEVGVKGARVKGVLGDIASNADFVRKRIKDAGLAINENGYLSETAAKKQETFAATIDKIKKEFELVGSNDGFRNFIKTSSDLLLGFIKILTAIPFGVVATGLTLITAAWAYYKGMMIQATVTAAWNNSQSLLGIVRNKAARLGLLGEAEALRAHTIQTNANTMARGLNVASLESQIAGERAAIIALEAKTAANHAEAVAISEQIAAKRALIFALEAEVVATNEATVATAGLNAASKASPLGIVLSVLAVLVPLMMSFADNTEEAAKKTRTLAENQKDLNDAMDKGVKNAAEEVSHLDELYHKYTNANTPIKERKEILKELQDYYPSYFGNLTTEKNLNDKLTASYQELRDAIVGAARADAIRDKLKGRMSERLTRDEQLNRDIQKESEANKTLRADAKTKKVQRTRVDGGDGKSFVIELESTDLLKASDQRVKNLERVRKNNEKADEEEDKILLDMAFKEDKRTAKLRADRANRLGKFVKPDDEEKKKDKVYSGAKLTGEQKDRLNIFQSDRDMGIAELTRQQNEGLINEQQFQEKRIAIIQKYAEAIQNYLKSSNAKEKQIEGAVRLRAYTEMKTALKEQSDFFAKQSEENYKKTKNTLEIQSKELEKNNFLTDSERLEKQIEIDSQSLLKAQEYYSEQISIATSYHQDTLELERKRDEEIGKIQDSRSDKFQSRLEAYKKDLERETAIATAKSDLSIEEQKSLIISNKKLSNSEKEYRLGLLEIDQQIKSNQIQVDSLIKEKAKYDLRVAMAKLAGKQDVEAEKKVADKDLEIERLKNEIKKLKGEAFDAIDQRTQTIRDTIAKGFGDLGFAGFGDAYAKTMDRMKNKTLEWQDYAVMAASAVLDSLTQLNNRQKEQTIANLDEQLKHSQETTEQEIGFINERLGYLNNLDELTKEQMSERNRLEDEARTYKEQQFQREKMIAAQKAKAEQRAAAQQALINGALAATMTLAQLGFIAGAIPAALALAFGIAQSIAISSKNPVPEYWVGRNNGPAEFALTQERGREIITDNAGNVTDQGSNSGSKMTWLNKGDRVFTADQSRQIIADLGGLPKIGQNIFKKAAMNSLKAPSVIMITQPGGTIDENKIIEGLAARFESTFKRYTNSTIIKKNGKIIEKNGANIGVILGEYDLKTGEETWYQ
ncbi:phage tail tape measure protein [uncultured Chryseobacterium sp.]|uniref:phage tail tape measure protein n=1 Tax=uncultured Chryseobacterium sp. TaxID=259322 RepID=UPI0025F3A6A3|nr:phage tail tape measure protein [uncultured Chryseobacterium sp.]